MNDVPEMVARVARCLDPIAWANRDSLIVAQTVIKARSLIEAMREPTAEMAHAGKVGISKHSFPELQAQAAWGGMINAALGKITA